MGSNLGDDNITSLFFAETTLLKRDCYVTVKPGLLETTSATETRQEAIRINLLQVAPSTIIVIISMCVNEIKALARWPKKRTPTMGIPH